MKAKRITAKIRDMVPVCLMVGDAEVKRYNNIQLPDAIKELEITGFHFDLSPIDGKITFQLFFEPGVLPEVFPAEKPRVLRKEKPEHTTTALALPFKPIIPAPSKPALQIPAVIELGPIPKIKKTPAKKKAARKPAANTPKPATRKPTAKKTPAKKTA